ncbi:amino acid permease [Jatrophihabitans endophyticus]|uniref:amino acid permease n=1 Tax=Jatrophihabitans endophyticus TaxID=1206085 RepID=UPI0019E3E45C|nr:amino acid permease [Jatrophihabitans endophyticus]MBE7187099.1 amino acid permease [Jatrophihabitans endophyticus]
MTLAPARAARTADAGAEHPRRLGWIQTTSLAMGGSNQSLFLLGTLLLAQGSAAVPLLVIGLGLAWMALPGWIELILIWPRRVGGIAATCAEAFRPYSAVLANLTGVCYWWGWVPTCGLTALLSADALHAWLLPTVSTTLVAIGIIVVFTAVNLCGVQWVGRIAVPIAVVSALLAFLSAVVPVFSGSVDWHQALDFSLSAPFHGVFGQVTSAMAGLYLVGFAAPAFEAASCHVGETKNPAVNVPRAMYASAGTASLYFVVLPVVWLGTLGDSTLTHSLTDVLGPTFAPLLGGTAKSAAVLFMVFNMFHGTLQPLAGAARTLSQLAEDGLLPRLLERRLRRTDVPWVATVLTAGMAIAFLLAGDPTWLVAAANLTYLIGIALPNVAVWLLRRNEPDLPRLYRASTWGIRLGLVSALGWMVATILGFEQYGLPTVLFGVALAYSGSVLYMWRVISDRRRARLSAGVRSMHVKLTGAMLAVLVIDGAGYLLAVDHMPRDDAALVTGLQDLFVAVALLTISVGLVLPGTIAHSSSQVMQSADRLATGTLRQLTSGLMALSRADLAGAHVQVSEPRVVVYSRDEIGAMAASFNTMIGEIERAAASLDLARERLRMHTEDLESQVALRTAALEQVNGELEAAKLERGRLLDEAVERLETQRRSIAADLHDGPIQRLTAIGMMLDRATLAGQRRDLNTLDTRLDGARSELQHEIAALRRMMAGLRPPVLDERGLAAAIADYVRSECQRLGISARVDLDEVALDPTVETTLYRVVQEGLSNVARHSSATSLVVTLHSNHDGAEAELVVQDDGVGMGEQDLRRLVRDGHYGLAGMRERVEMIGGRLGIERPAVGGTRLRATVEGLTPGTTGLELGTSQDMSTVSAGAGSGVVAEVGA